MKKLFLTAMIAVLSVVCIHAQASFGVKAGVNFANMTGDVADNSMLTGVHIGVIGEFKVSDKFSVQPELLYAMQGYKSKDFDGLVTSDDTLKLSYINLPVMLKYYMIEGMSIEFGPQIGILLAAKADGSEIYEGETTSWKDYDMDEYLEKVDFSLNFGLGYELENNLFFQARYTIGLSDISKQEEGYEGKLKNNVIQLSVGYKFN
ncbi:MAG: PorT family protein [Flavobacteriaceae bacterium]|nr:PorT family protein [Flavobacteriaceae bacterium]